MLKNSLEQKKFFALIKHRGERDHPLTRATAYYQDLYERFGLGKWFLSWNWAAFLWGVTGLQCTWFFYRRMYLYGFGLCLLQLFIVQTMVRVSKIFGLDFFFLRIGTRLACMLIALGLGVFANVLYFHFLKNKIKNSSVSVPDGGTNWGVVAVIGIIFFIYLNILYHNAELMPPELREFFTK